MYMMKYYLTIRGSDILTHTTVCIKLENTVSNEKGQREDRLSDSIMLRLGKSIEKSV